jgi:hypothetical protein
LKKSCHVILDFSRVNEIGQAHAYEIFRVIRVAHPETVIVPTHIKSDVKDMVNRITSKGAS